MTNPHRSPLARVSLPSSVPRGAPGNSARAACQAPQTMIASRSAPARAASPSRVSSGTSRVVIDITRHASGPTPG
jgi:hypothetical protein